MIPLTDVAWQSLSWQEHLQNAVTDISTLVSLLGIPAESVQTPFPLLVPLPFLARMVHGDPDDPLLRQVLPVHAELEQTDGYSLDPLRELAQSPTDGMLHKYHGRVLVIASGACAINCRYCFRRHFPYQSFQPDTDAWQHIFDYVRRDPSITEVILSGGDPLVQTDRRLSWIAENIAAIPHVTTLRIHTRLPIVIPNRVCAALLDWLAATPLRVVIVLHANHARELDQSVADATAMLARSGVTLFNQSVLLRGVNDSARALIDLSQRLFTIGVLPYYLHLPDRVIGTRHFDVDDDKAHQIMREVAASLPGYLVPRLVREVPGATAKVAENWE
jgi:L-lysine 2,3-aminomutase